MPNIIAPVGTLQVGADGAGQMRGHVQSATVRHLAGMMVVVLPSMSDGGGARDLSADQKREQLEASAASTIAWVSSMTQAAVSAPSRRGRSASSKAAARSNPQPGQTIHRRPPPITPQPSGARHRQHSTHGKHLRHAGKSFAAS